MFPIQHRTCVHEVGNRRRDLLPRGAWVRPGRRGQSGLHEQVPKREVLLGASAASKQRIGRVLIRRISVNVVRAGFQPFENRPAEVQAWSRDHAQLFPCIVTDVSETEHPRISVGGVVAPRPRTQRQPKGLPYTERPDAGPRRAYRQAVPAMIVSARFA